jgi:hypothetical protein
MPGQHEFRRPLISYTIAVISGGSAGALLLGLVFAAGPGLTDAASIYSGLGSLPVSAIAIYGLAAAIAFGLIGAPLTFATIRWVPPCNRSSPLGYMVLGPVVVVLIGVWPIILSTSWSEFPIWFLMVPSMCCGGAVAGYVFWWLSVRPLPVSAC